MQADNVHGGIDQSNKEKEIRKKAKSQFEYSGNISLKEKEHLEKIARVTDKKASEYTGTYPEDMYKHHQKMMREIDKENSNYEGTISGKYLYKQEKSIRKLDKEMASYQGDLKIKQYEKFVNKPKEPIGIKAKVKSFTKYKSLARSILNLPPPQKKKKPKVGPKIYFTSS